MTVGRKFVMCSSLDALLWRNIRACAWFSSRCAIEASVAALYSALHLSDRLRATVEASEVRSSVADTKRLPQATCAWIASSYLALSEEITVRTAFSISDWLSDCNSRVAHPGTSVSKNDISNILRIAIFSSLNTALNCKSQKVTRSSEEELRVCTVCTVSRAFSVNFYTCTQEKLPQKALETVQTVQSKILHVQPAK